MKNKALLYFTVFTSLTFLSFSSCKKTLSLEDSGKQSIFALTDINMNKLPNFSHVGYLQGDSPLPTVKVVKTLEAISGDNSKAIQEAIEEVSRLPLDEKGHRGAILLKSGNYQLNRGLIISESGVVLRGEGQGENGTVLTDYRKPNSTNRSYLKSFNTISIESKNATIQSRSAPVRLAEDAFVGDRSIKVENIGNLQKGDVINITKAANSQWINALNMSINNWTTEFYQIQHRRVVESVEGNTIFLNSSLVDDFQLEYGGGFVSKISITNRIEKSAVENLRLRSTYEHLEDENHVWNGIYVNGAQNSWIRNVTAEFFAFSAIWLTNSDYCTIQDCAAINFRSEILGDRRTAFIIGLESSFNFFQRCYVEDSRHDFTTAAKVAGPNVFLDCIGVNTISDTGPHQRWASGTLYDNIYSSLIYARDAGFSGSGQGWTGVYQVFWNNRATLGFLVQSPTLGKNWLVGAIGRLYTQNTVSTISPGVRVLPRSLYIKQLMLRRGERGAGEILHKSQTGDNPIWDDLRQWAGSGAPIELPAYLKI